MSHMSATGRLTSRPPSTGVAPGVVRGESTVTARRLGSARWRDPRLAVGIVLMSASVILGVRVVDAADDTVPVWSVQEDVSAGSPLTASQLTARHVHFDGDDARLYLSADAALPRGMVLDHDVSAGELLAVSSLRLETDTSAAELPLAVSSGSLPADLAPGDLVDVWVTPDPAEPGPTSAAAEVLSEVSIVSLDTSSAALGAGDATRILIALDDAAVAGLGETLSRLSSGQVVLVRKSG